MEVKPVRLNRSAKYPTKQALSEKPELLKAMPYRWRAIKAVATLVGSVSLLAAARSVQQQGKQEYITFGTPAFPPGYYLSIDILNAFEREAKKTGLHLVSKGRHVPVKVARASSTQTIRIAIDKIDPKTGIGFEFVSEADCIEAYGMGSDKGPQDLANAVRKGLKNVKNGDRIKVLASTTEDSGKQVRKATREIKSFFDWLKKQGVI